MVEQLSLSLNISVNIKRLKRREVNGEIIQRHFTPFNNVHGVGTGRSVAGIYKYLRIRGIRRARLI